MDGYSLTEKMRKARRTFRLSATEQALFHELVAICNGEGWEDVFVCSNAELCYTLNVSEKTLIRSRDRLIAAGLVFYKSGKSKRDVGRYSFIKKLQTTVITTVITTGNITVDTTANTTANVSANVSEKLQTNNKTKTKRKTITPLPPKVDSEKKGDNKKEKYADFVSMTNAEYQVLVAKVGESGAKRCIEILDNYKGANGKRYKSDYRAILNWVIDRYNGEMMKRPTREKESERNYDEQF